MAFPAIRRKTHHHPSSVKPVENSNKPYEYEYVSKSLLYVELIISLKLIKWNLLRRFDCSALAFLGSRCYCWVSRHNSRLVWPGQLERAQPLHAAEDWNAWNFHFSPFNFSLFLVIIISLRFVRLELSSLVIRDGSMRCLKQPKSSSTHIFIPLELSTMMRCSKNAHKKKKKREKSFHFQSINDSCVWEILPFIYEIRKNWFLISRKKQPKKSVSFPHTIVHIRIRTKNCLHFSQSPRSRAQSAVAGRRVISSTFLSPLLSRARTRKRTDGKCSKNWTNKCFCSWSPHSIARAKLQKINSKFLRRGGSDFFFEISKEK